ncbi:MAG: NAD(P)/FAD-dependent oxidoreductase [Oscillospiraceae bacterium]|nr:NAD(P)/FAD-dependent oxidoreductase [Oscillospiraceae bacterium]
MSYDFVVVGGGAAGMLAAGAAASLGVKVLLLEKNEKLGRKLFITGKGRCNLTNNCSVQEALAHIPTGSKFLYSALNGFSPDDAMVLFESLGVRLKTERGGRVFPQSDKSYEIIDALKRFMLKNGVVIRHDRVSAISVNDNDLLDITTTSQTISCSNVLLATGGKSYPATGATGDGYDWAKKLGHTVTPLRGSLVPLCAESELCASMQGLALKNVALSVFDGGKKAIFSDLGELLFTHFGLSGPLVLSASAHMRKFETKQYHVTIDLKPGLDEKKLDLRILKDFDQFKSRDFCNALGDLLAKSMIPAIIRRSDIAPEKKVHSISREERRNLVRLIKSFRIDIDGPRPVDEAIITSGGIELNEMNPKTMESKLVSGLYFAGEIIDADAYTGGFNLQIAWSTAIAAAKAVAANVIEKGNGH